MIVLCDENTVAHCLPYFEATYLEGLKIPIETVTIPAGESNKSIQQAEMVWNRLIDQEIDRDALFISLGGGVITDLGGFVSASYKRGIRAIHVPTTHLAMTDAALGGKNGINYGGLKNQIGTLYHPIAVLIDHHFLETLPQRELESGWIETVKHAWIADRSLWREIKVRDAFSAMRDANILKTSAHIKLQITAADEADLGIRQCLNFGHTIGHALEAQQNLLHGEAVAFGLIAELYLSHIHLGLDKTAFTEALAYLKRYHACLQAVSINMDDMMRSMRNDKKNRGGRIRFSLISQFGQAEVGITVSDEDIHNAVAFATKEINT